MCQVLGGRRQHFRTEEAAAGGICVDIQQALVPEKDARTALVLEARLSGSEATRLQRTESAPDDADLRIGKNNADRCAAQAGLDLPAQREACSILACNAPLVGGLVQ